MCGRKVNWTSSRNSLVTNRMPPTQFTIINSTQKTPFFIKKEYRLSLKNLNICTIFIYGNVRFAPGFEDLNLEGFKFVYIKLNIKLELQLNLKQLLTFVILGFSFSPRFKFSQWIESENTFSWLSLLSSEPETIHFPPVTEKFAKTQYFWFEWPWYVLRHFPFA